MFRVTMYAENHTDNNSSPPSLYTITIGINTNDERIRPLINTQQQRVSHY